jgi:hypothetical protein
VFSSIAAGLLPGEARIGKAGVGLDRIGETAPAELLNPRSFTFAVGLMANSKQPDAARSLMQYLVNSSMQSTLKSKGRQPGE